MQQAKELLENWAAFLGVDKRRRYKAIGMYLTPEEKAQQGQTCRESRLSEADALRADAVVAMLRQSSIYQSFAVLLEKHFMYRANPVGVCKRVGLNVNDYDAHVAKAVSIFWMHWQLFGSVPTKMIRMGSVNNRLTATKPQTNLTATT